MEVRNPGKLNSEETKHLVETKHSSKYIDMFSRVEGNPIRLKKAWEELSNEFPPPVKPQYIKDKYNQLLVKYKNELTLSGQTGTAASTWSYWNTFNKTFPKNKPLIMQNTLELGSDKIDPIHSAEKSTTQENSSKKSRSENNLKDLRTDALKKMCNFMDFEMKIKIEKKSRSWRRKWNLQKMKSWTS